MALADMANRLANKTDHDALHAVEDRLTKVLADQAKTADEKFALVAQHLQVLAARPAGPSRLPEIVLGTLRAVAMVLAVRFLLLLALAGTFVLAVMAMQAQSVIAVCLTAAFAILTLAPLVLVEIRHRPPPSLPAA